MRQDRTAGAPDYTTATLVMLGLNLMWVFMALWATVGLLPVLLLAAGLNRAIGWVARHRRG